MRVRNTKYPDGVDLEANLIKQEMIAELHAALDELEEMDRTIMKMFGDGATEKQIAEVVHLSQKGVNKRKKEPHSSFRLLFQSLPLPCRLFLFLHLST